MTTINQDQLIKNLSKCPHFNACSQNLCPLDLELPERTGGKQEKCRWMREAKTSKIAGREFVSGGGVMPDALLNFVPSDNLDWLNEPSKKRWHELKKT
jgi:hypothetical protein